LATERSLPRRRPRGPTVSARPTGSRDLARSPTVNLRLPLHPHGNRPACGSPRRGARSLDARRGSRRTPRVRPINLGAASSAGRRRASRAPILTPGERSAAAGGFARTFDQQI